MRGMEIEGEKRELRGLQDDGDADGETGESEKGGSRENRVNLLFRAVACQYRLHARSCSALQYTNVRKASPLSLLFL